MKAGKNKMENHRKKTVVTVIRTSMMKPDATVTEIPLMIPMKTGWKLYFAACSDPVRVLK